MSLTTQISDDQVGLHYRLSTAATTETMIEPAMATQTRTTTTTTSSLEGVFDFTSELTKKITTTTTTPATAIALRDLSKRPEQQMDGPIYLPVVFFIAIYAIFATIFLLYRRNPQSSRFSWLRWCCPCLSVPVSVLNHYLIFFLNYLN